MTSHERILDAMSLRTPDRVPMSPILTRGWIAAAGVERTRKFTKETDSILVVGIAPDIPLGRYGEEKRRISAEGEKETHRLPTPRPLGSRSNFSRMSLMWRNSCLFPIRRLARR